MNEPRPDQSQHQISDRRSGTRLFAIGLSVSLNGLFLIALVAFRYTSTDRARQVPALIEVPIEFALHHKSHPTTTSKDKTNAVFGGQENPWSTISPEVQQYPPKDSAISIGRSLACGSSIYEFLSEEQRRACIRKPWTPADSEAVALTHFPDVLVDRVTGIEALRHEQQTVDPCLITKEQHGATECIYHIIWGDKPP